MTAGTDALLKKLLARQRHLMVEMGNVSRSGQRASDSTESEVKLLGEEIARLSWQKMYGCVKSSVKTTAVDPLADKTADDDGTEWYRVLETKVLIKKGMSVKAKTWGWVVKDRTIQVLPGRLKDELGQEWVEITQFELWRSCSENADGGLVRYFNEGRGFALVDGSLLVRSNGTLLGLGAFLCGPLRSGAWRNPCDEEVQEYRRWCTMATYDSSSREQQPETPSRHAESTSWERFEVTHVRLNVYEKPQMDSRVLQQRRRGEIVVVAGETRWLDEVG